MPIALNAHHFGGSKNLPPGSVLVDRSTPYGNPFSSKSGKYTKLECVGFHRVDLYKQLIEDKTYFSRLKHDLEGKDLVCWCVHPKRIKPCHTQNYLHVLSKDLINRTYDKTVISYLLDDITRAIRSLKTYTKTIVSDTEWLSITMGLGDITLDITELLRIFKERKTDPYIRCLWLSCITIDLELATLETDTTMRLYRLDHVSWLCYRFTYQPDGREGEPVDPSRSIKTTKKKNDFK